ncbi:MAG: hypothetical protein ACMVO5_05945 [Polymorphobacter sp.]|uniref:hypothetical protein n=1 Tax=Polymorphobacter sp. TaxID=1909290 RepID=UPI003A8B5A46
MAYRNWQWRVKDRRRFIDTLAETGNPAAAAAAIGRTLAEAYAMRERWPQLANEWQQALGVAWEQVEMRMLATLLEGEAGDIDPKVALEMLKRRPKVAPLAAGVTLDATRLARVRSEIRALVAPQE